MIDPLNDGSEATWKKTSNPNYPVSYSRTTNPLSPVKPTVKARFKVTPAFNTTLGFAVRAKLNGTVVGQAVLDITGQYGTATMTLDITNSTVAASNYTLIWEVWDYYSPWVAGGQSGPHTIYWTYDAPLSPKFYNHFHDASFTPLYTKALQKACTYANGLSNIELIASAVAAGVANDLTYDPGAQLGANIHPLKAYTFDTMCADHAALGEGLMRSIGINMPVRYLFAGSDNKTAIYYQTGAGPNLPCTARFNRPANNLAQALPHFRYHAALYYYLNGTLYDTSYGDSYAEAWTPLEVAPGNTAKTQSDYHMIDFNWSNPVYTCPH